MTGEQLLCELLKLNNTANMKQEVYIKSGSKWWPVDGLKLDIDSGIVLEICKQELK